MSDIELIPQRLDGLRIVLGEDACHMCDSHDFPGQNVAFRPMACPKCKGTGRRGNGRCRNCAYYSEPYRSNKLEPGHVPDYDQPYPVGPCGSCKGTRKLAQDWSSYVTPEVMGQIVDKIGVKVYPMDRELSRGESLLGMLPYVDGERALALFSITDYGRSWDKLAEAARPTYEGEPKDERMARITAALDIMADDIADKLKADRTQICKIADRKTLVIGECIVVLLARNGYTVATRPRKTTEVHA